VDGNKLQHQYQPDTMRVVAGGEWRDARTFVVTWTFVESGPYMCFDRSVNVNSSATELPTLTGTRSAHSGGLPCALPLVQADETAARGDLAFEEALSPDLLADLRRGRPAISEPELGDR
jgi:hypothetical protein